MLRTSRTYFVLVACLASLRCASTGSLAPETVDGRLMRLTADSLSLEDQVAQMLVIRASGEYASEDSPQRTAYRDLAANPGYGGILIERGSPDTRRVLVSEIGALGPAPPLVLQPLRPTGGVDVRGATALPSFDAVFATTNPDYSYDSGYVAAAEATAMGSHMLLLEATFDPPAHPEFVGRRESGELEAADLFTRAHLDGIRDGGALAAITIFAGDRSPTGPAALEGPGVGYAIERARDYVEAGIDAIIVGHARVPAMDPSNPSTPASVLPAASGEFARTRLGFTGVVIADDLSNPVIADHYFPGEAAVAAVMAGADLLLTPPDPEVAHRAILRAVRSGRISRQKIRESVERVMALKRKVLNPGGRSTSGSVENRVGDRNHALVASTIARESLTLLSNDRGVLPLRPMQPPPSLVILPDDGGTRWASGFASRITRLSRTPLLAPVRADARTSDQLSESVEAGVPIIVAFNLQVQWSAEERDRLESLLRDAAESGSPVVAVSFGQAATLPFDPAKPEAILIAHDTLAVTQRVAADALFGLSHIRGRLPLSLSDRFGIGSGLDLTQVRPRWDLPEAAGMSSDRLAAVDSLIRSSVADTAFPGAAVVIGRADIVTALRGYGFYTYETDDRITSRSLFDLASLTKVIATTTATMKLVERDLLSLDARIVDLLPEMRGDEAKSDVTVRHLLEHTSGLPAYRAFHRMGYRTGDAVWDTIVADTLVSRPGEKYRYSDLGMIILGRILERVTGRDFRTLADSLVFQPLGMNSSGYLDVNYPDPSAVPTELDTTFRMTIVQGAVHDETAYLLGGTAGHAGLFSTAADLALFADMLVKKGRVGDTQFLKPETVRLFTTRTGSVQESARALGWDTRSPEGYSSAGSLFGPRSFGHTGFTGTSIWFDPDSDVYVILLSNRVYPTRSNTKVYAVRPRLADIAHRAILSDSVPLVPHAIRRQTPGRNIR